MVNNSSALAPRNLKQVQNRKQTLNKKKRIGHDEIYNIHVLHYELGYVHFVQTIPFLEVIAFDKLLIQQLKEVMKLSSKKLFMTYDTTFNIGDFYCSPLILKNSMFTIEPAVPLGFLYHEKKDQRAHQHFFEYFKKEIPDLETFCVIAVDGEEAINNAIKIELPRIPILRCWRHLAG